MSDDAFDPLDPLDRELRRRFDAAAPSPGVDGDDGASVDVMLDTMRPRWRRARTRHRAALAGAAAGVLALVVVAGFALTGGSSDPKVHTPPATRSTTPGPTVTTTAPVTPTPTVDDGGSGHDGSSGDDSTTSTPATDGAGNGVTSNSGTGDATNPPSAPTTQQFPSAGGTITVSLANGVASLASQAPVTGATGEVHDNGPDRVEVRFFDADHHEISRVRVDVVNGVLVQQQT